MRTVTRLAAAAVVAAGVATASLAPASAHPIVRGGLVDVVIGDVTFLNDVNVAVGLAVAANLCDVNVNVLAVQLREGSAQCESNAGPVTITQS